MDPMIPGRAAAALPANLARARPRACRCFLIHSLTPPLSDGFGAGDGVPPAPPPVIARTRVLIADCCKDACDRYPLFAEQSSNSLSQRLVFMEEPPDGLTNSVDLRPESCSIRREGFEPRLPFKLDVGRLAFKLLHSVLNILLNFGVVRFGQFSAFPGQVLFDFGFPVVDCRLASRGCQRARPSISSWPPKLRLVLFWPV